jgi:hypothetical protein
MVSDPAHCLDILAKDDLHTMAEPSLLVRTEELLTERRRLDGEIARSLLALDAREVTINECGRATRSWLVEEQHVSVAAAGAMLRLARSYPYRPAIVEHLAAGELSHEHARVILGCLPKLLPDWRDAAEAELIGFAAEHDPDTLAALCRELRIRTGADDDAEAAEQRRYESRWLTTSRTFEGMLSIAGMLDPESGAVLTTALDALMAPVPEDERTTVQARADALVELAHHTLRSADLPDRGGDRPQLVITTSYTELRDGLTAGQLPTALLNGRDPITPATVRRLACDANLIPAVLGSRGEVLDLGTSTPTWSPAQRRARRIEDRGCTWPQCQTPLCRCQIHHLHYVSRGGPTDIANGTHLCRFHHWLTHNRNWHVWRDANGKIQVRRT